MDSSRFRNAGLDTPDESCIPAERLADVREMFDTWRRVRPRNERLRMYYTQHNPMVELSSTEADDDVDVQEQVGWAKAAVDSLAMRSILDGFVFEGQEDEGFNRLVRENALDTDLYPQAVVSALTYGVGWFTVMRGNAGQPDAMVRHFSATQAVGTWDDDGRCLKCGMVLNSVDKDGRALRYTAFWPDKVLTFERTPTLTGSLSAWECSEEPNDLGVMMMVPMVFEPDADRPLGHSRITPEIMLTTDRAMRQLKNLDVGCNSYVWPQRWMMGVDQDLFEQHDEDGNVIGVNKTRREVYQGKILAMTRDENGDIPSVGQFSQADVSPLVRAYEQAAQQICGATHVPINELGVLSSNYTSSDALQASSKALELDVERMNRRNAHTLETVALLMMSVAGKTTPDRLTGEQRSVRANFRDPSMPTIQATCDANMKLASVDDGYAGTRVFYENNGWSEARIDRYFAERQRNEARRTAMAILETSIGADIEAVDGGDEPLQGEPEQG